MWRPLCSSSRWWVGFIPLGRRARVTITVEWLDPTYYLRKKCLSRGILFTPGTMYAKASHETSLDLDSCFDHHLVSSAGLRQPHWWMNTSGFESSYSVVKLFHFPTLVSDSWYCDASTSSKWYKSHSSSRTAISYIHWTMVHTRDHESITRGSGFEPLWCSSISVVALDLLMKP